MRPKFYIGIDEVGRGPLAGPVAVGAVAVTPYVLRKFRAIKESKQLSALQREEWLALMEMHEGESLRIAVSMVAHDVIDRIGIVPAITRALRRSIKKLGIAPEECSVLLDGGLSAPDEFFRQRTIIRGDAKKTVIAMASVAAKVKRDRHMVRIHKIHPEYGFDTHKGYGTKKHRELIRVHGLSALHRESFCTKIRGGK